MRRSAVAAFLLFLFSGPVLAQAQDGVRTSLAAVVAAKDFQTQLSKLAAAKETPDYSKAPLSDLFVRVFNTPALLKLGPPRAQDLNWSVEWLGAASTAYQALLNFGPQPGEAGGAVVERNVVRFEDDATRAMDFLVRMTPRVANAGTAFMEGLPEKERNQPGRQQGFAKMRAGVIQTVSGAITFTGAGAKPANARLLAAALRDTVNEWAKFAQADDRTRLLNQLANARTGAKDEKVSADLLEVSKVLAAAK